MKTFSVLAYSRAMDADVLVENLAAEDENDAREIVLESFPSICVMAVEEVR